MENILGHSQSYGLVSEPGMSTESPIPYPSRVSRPLVLFAPAFTSWPMEFIKSAKRADTKFSFVALVTGTARTVDTVSAFCRQEGAPAYALDTLEREWITREPSIADRATVEASWTNFDLKRIVIGDRNVGHRYLRGGFFPETELNRACKDEQVAERYLINLCIWIHRCAEEHRFDSVFCYAVAGAPAVALAIFCANVGLRFCRLTPTRLGRLSMIDTSFTDEYLPARVRFSKYIESPFVEDEHTAFARRYLEQFRQSPRKPDFAIQVQREVGRRMSIPWALRSSVGALARQLKRQLQPGYIRSPVGLRSVIHAALDPLHGARLLKRWPHHSAADIAGHPYAYYPLHLDPEATTMVFAPMFTDQLAVIEALSKALPLGMRLVVKEHFPMLGKRPPGFYSQIVKFGNTLLVSPTSNNFDLIRNADLVCVISGTAALEALMFGRPALAFGRTPFEIIGEGLLRCTDFDALPAKIEEAKKMPRASERNLIAYLSALHSISFELDVWQTQPEAFALDERERLVREFWKGVETAFELIESRSGEAGSLHAVSG